MNWRDTTDWEFLLDCMLPFSLSPPPLSLPLSCLYLSKLRPIFIGFRPHPTNSEMFGGRSNSGDQNGRSFITSPYRNRSKSSDLRRIRPVVHPIMCNITLYLHFFGWWRLISLLVASLATIMTIFVQFTFKNITNIWRYYKYKYYCHSQWPNPTYSQNDVCLLVVFQTGDDHIWVELFYIKKNFTFQLCSLLILEFRHMIPLSIRLVSKTYLKV